MTKSPPPRHLLTTADWYAEAVHRAAVHAGSPEARAALAEAHRYEALGATIAALDAKLAEVTAELDAAKESARLQAEINFNAALNSNKIEEALAKAKDERDALAARLAEIERAEPVCWRVCWPDGEEAGFASSQEAAEFEEHSRGMVVRPLYDRPAAPAKLDPVEGDSLPPIGSTVWIRHGSDDDAHECTVIGYYAWDDLGGDPRLHRVNVRLQYAGSTLQNARMLADCWPTREAALAGLEGQSFAASPARRAGGSHCADATAPAKREPLTRDRIIQLWHESDQPTDENGHATGPVQFARAIERDHGIGSNEAGQPGSAYPGDAT